MVVYDLGGGTFDCCIVVIENGRYSILHSDGHSHLGGADFDNAIVRLMAAELKDKGVDVYESRKDLSKLKDLAEKAKIALSNADSYNLKHMIVNPITMEKVEYEHMLTRVEFESLIKDYIDNTIKYIRRALESSGLKPQNISCVIPIGGSTRIPYVKQRLEEFFERKIESPVNIDEGVAEGAAIDAGRTVQRRESAAGRAYGQPAQSGGRRAAGGAELLSSRHLLQRGRRVQPHVRGGDAVGHAEGRHHGHPREPTHLSGTQLREEGAT